jgi:hypothetical protein
MSREPKLWIVISRPDRLPNALVAADALRERFPGGIHLLREESKWWENANWEEFVRDFAEVHAFPKVKTCRGLKDLPRLYRENVDRQRGVGALPIDPDHDVLLCLAGLLGLGNAALSAHPNVFKILSASQKAFGELTRHGDLQRRDGCKIGWSSRWLAWKERSITSRESIQAATGCGCGAYKRIQKKFSTS